MVWSPTIPEKQVDEETMKRYKLVVEQLIEANFHECMLAQNYNTPSQTHKVSGYIKGSEVTEFLVNCNDVASGLNEIDSEEKAAELIEKILACHLVKKSERVAPDAVKQVCAPLMIRVHAARLPVDEKTRLRVLAEARKKDSSVLPEDVAMPKGKVDRRDGKQLFYPTMERPSHARSPDSHPVRFRPSGAYVLVHRPDMTSTYYWYLTLAILGGLAITTFRLWPPIVQLWVWYLSVTVLVVILGFSILQGLIFLVFYTVGFELWIFPNMFDERVHVTEWFTTPIDVTWSGGSWLLRMLALGAIVAAGVWIYNLSAMEMEEMSNHSVQFVEELYSGKLLEGAAPSQFGPGGKRIPAFEELQRLAEQEANEETGAAGGKAPPSSTGSSHKAESEEEEEEEEDGHDGGERSRHGDTPARSQGLDEDEDGYRHEDETGDGQDDENDLGSDDDSRSSLEDMLREELARAAEGEDENEDE